jgi:hypothetical protein
MGVHWFHCALMGRINENFKTKTHLIDTLFLREYEALFAMRVSKLHIFSV